MKRIDWSVDDGEDEWNGKKKNEPLAWMWKTVAPAFQHFSISSTISSGVTGTKGVIDLVGTLPVKATDYCLTKHFSVD